MTCLAIVARSQDQGPYLQDAQIRTYLNLEKNIGKRFTIFLDQQYRFTNNASTYTRGSGELGITFKLSKNLRIFASYKYLQKLSDKMYWNQRNWYTGGLTFRKSFGYWKVLVRGLIQARNGNINSPKEYLTKLYNRDKVTLRYEITKRISGYVAGEIYIPLNNPQHTGFDRFRSSIGVGIKTFKNQQLDIHFMYQQWVQRGGWWDANDGARDRMLKKTYILGIGYDIEF